MEIFITSSYFLLRLFAGGAGIIVGIPVLIIYLLIRLQEITEPKYGYRYSLLIIKVIGGLIIIPALVLIFTLAVYFSDWLIGTS